MKILVLVHEYPPVGGGGGKVAQDLAVGLQRRGHQVTVLTSAWGDLPSDASDQGVRVRRLWVARRTPYRASLLSMALYVVQAVRVGVGLLGKDRPDVLHVHFAVPAGAAGWLLARLGRVPYVLTAHLGDVPGGAPEKTRGWFRWLFPFTPPIWRGAAQVVAVSAFTQTLARQHYPVPIRVIPNGVAVQRLRPTQIRVHRPPQVVFAGRFVPQKNPLMLVRALARVRDLAWRAVLLGDGPLRPQVQQAIRQAGLTDRFVLPGWVQPAEVLAHFDQSDLLFMPSRSEGLPVVGVQALAKGLAIVAGRAGGLVDVVVPDENGALLDPDDEDGFAAALRRLLSDPAALQKAREASLRLAENFDLERIVSAYENLFRRVTRRAAG